MANMSNYLENKILNWLFRGQSFSPPSTLYVALLTEPIDDTVVLGADLPEVSQGSDPSAEGAYTRKAIASSKWSDPNDPTSLGIIKNTEEIKWEKVAWEETITAIALCDQQNPLSGNVLFWGDLVKEKVVTPDDTISFGISAITVQIDNDREAAE